MAKTKPKAAAPRTWADTPGTYIAGRANVDAADKVAIEMEAKWGADRLRLLVNTELCEKFDRQRYKYNQAIWHGDLETLRQEAARMINAWRALDAAAEAAGACKQSPLVWEVALADGSVAAIVPDDGDAKWVIADEGRAIVVYSLEEIGRLLSAFPNIAQAKAVFPGATVTAVRKSIDDPLDGLRDSKADLDDPIDDIEAFAHAG